MNAILLLCDTLPKTSLWGGGALCPVVQVANHAARLGRQPGSRAPRQRRIALNRETEPVARFRGPALDPGPRDHLFRRGIFERAETRRHVPGVIK